MTSSPSASPLTAQDLAQFTGTEQWYRCALNRKLLYTDGVRHVAEHGGAYWLIDEIICVQLIRSVAAESFQFWQLVVGADRSAMLTCEDGNGALVYQKRIPFTDFPLQRIAFYFTGGVLLLPSEY